jgi:hypothetical protein
VTFKRSNQFGTRALQTLRSERGQLKRIGLASDHGFENMPSAGTDDLADERCQFDVGVLKRLLNALNMPRCFAHQLRSRPGQVAQFLRRHRRHEAGADQTMGQQVGDPGRIVDIAFASLKVAHMRCVGKDQREVLFQYVPHQLPVNTGRLHRHVRDLLGLKPIAERQQIACRC